MPTKNVVKSYADPSEYATSYGIKTQINRLLIYAGRTDVGIKSRILLYLGGTPIDVGWYRITDQENHGYRRYSIIRPYVDFNTNIKFFYTDKFENFIEIPQGEGSTHVGTMMRTAELKDKLLYFTETGVQTPSACSIQGGKNKHKSYRRKRQQRRSKRRQSKRRQRKSK
jgi:hypothetical protein